MFQYMPANVAQKKSHYFQWDFCKAQLVIIAWAFAVLLMCADSSKVEQSVICCALHLGVCFSFFFFLGGGGGRSGGVCYMFVWFLVAYIESIFSLTSIVLLLPLVRLHQAV